MGLSRSALLALALAAPAAGADPEAVFREANDVARAGDFPKALVLYAELASSGTESASLYWNWAQAARARGALGEALWALLRARELEPRDGALARAIDDLRTELRLDAAELEPEPLAGFARLGRRFGLAWLAVGFALLSLFAHGAFRFARRPRGRTLAWTFGLLALVLALPTGLGQLARPTGVVVRRAAPLLPAASPTAESAGTLREGEVVPILDVSGGYLRLEDSAGARGWSLQGDVRRLDEAPPALVPAR
jgi:hypothetical protein